MYDERLGFSLAQTFPCIAHGPAVQSYHLHVSAHDAVCCFCALLSLQHIVVVLLPANLRILLILLIPPRPLL